MEKPTFLPVELLELVPLGANDNRLGIGTCLFCRLTDSHVGLDRLRRDTSVATTRHISQAQPDAATLALTRSCRARSEAQ